METKRKKLAIALLMLISMCCTNYNLTAQSNEGDDKTLSPYFFVKSEDSNLDQMPLKSTTAKVNIAGVIADVVVNQTYKNEGKKSIEAIYIFPASTRAAVHHMRMKIGERVIEARVKERNQARNEYETAIREGKSASLLEQQRPNVFQMNVGNIMPGDLIQVELEYTEIIIPEGGEYSFCFPTVVGPRYSNTPVVASTQDEKWISNPYLTEGTQPPNTFSIECNIAAGLPVSAINSNSHDIVVNYQGTDKANICLKGGNNFQGNKDFILNYRLCGNQVETGLLLFQGKTENFFLAMIQPPRKTSNSMIPKREYVFILDVSGSMSGYPLEISKKLAIDLISQLKSDDMFNILLFAGSSSVLSESSLQATPDNISRAQKFIDMQQGGGGTELLPALKRALSLQGSENIARTFIIATDGYVTVEKEAFDLIRNNLNKANFFAFGIGTAVNRYLIEGIAHCGMGSPFIVTKKEEADDIANKFRNYINSPVLTDIKINYEGFEVYDIEPLSIPDVFSERPVIVFGKYKGSPQGSITLTGLTGEEKYKERIDIASVTPQVSNSALRYLWAREKIRYLDDFSASLNPSEMKRVQDEVTGLGLKYNLLTKYTSFVATDSEKRNTTGNSTTVNQPLPLPSGVSNLAVGGVRQYQKSVGKASVPNVSNYKYDSNQREMDATPSVKEESKIMCIVEEMATFPGGETALRKFISSNLKYPEEARKKGISGKVFIEFIVEADGSINNIRVVRGLGGSCDEEAIRICKKMPKWKPARQEKANVRSKITLTFNFQ